MQLHSKDMACQNASFASLSNQSIRRNGQPNLVIGSQELTSTSQRLQICPCQRWFPVSHASKCCQVHIQKGHIPIDRLSRWSLRKKQQNIPSSTLQHLGIPDRACLLFIERKGDKKVSVTRLSPPERLESADMRTTGLIWARLKDRTKAAIAKSLRFECPLPPDYQWSLYDVRYTNSPSLTSRVLAHVSAEYTQSKNSEDGCIVTFVATHSYVGDHDKEDRKPKSTLFGQEPVPSFATQLGWVETFGGNQSIGDDFSRRTSSSRVEDPFSGLDLGMPQPPSLTPKPSGLQQDPNVTVSPPSKPLSLVKEKNKRSQWGNHKRHTGALNAARSSHHDYVEDGRLDAQQKERLWGLQGSGLPGDSVITAGDEPYPCSDPVSDKPYPHLASHEGFKEEQCHEDLFGAMPQAQSTSGASTEIYGRRYSDGSPEADQVDQFCGTGPSGVLQRDNTDSQELSDESVDDAELFDQLLQKYTGHHLRERANADESTHENVNNGVNPDVVKDISRDDDNHTDSIKE